MEGDLSKESKIFGVSLRGVIAFTIVASCCWMSIRSQEITEPLYTVFISAVAYYFGQKTK